MGQIVTTISFDKDNRVQITTDKGMAKVIQSVKGMGKTKAEKAKGLMIVGLATLGYLDKTNAEKVLRAAGQ